MSPERINVCRMCVSQKYYNWKQSLNISTLHTSYITVVHRKYGNIVFFFLHFTINFIVFVRSFIVSTKNTRLNSLLFVIVVAEWIAALTYACMCVGSPAQYASERTKWNFTHHNEMRKCRSKWQINNGSYIH